MSFLKGIRWLLVAITMSGTIFADVIIDNQRIPGTEIQAITVGPTSGDVFITTTTGYVVTPGGTEPPPSVATITRFFASPTVITAGQSTTITWESLNTSTCKATGGAPGWAAASVALTGSKSIVISDAGTYAFSLECVGDSGTDLEVISVTANAPAPNTNNCDAPSLSGTTVQWAAFWNNIPFPDPLYANEFTDIPRNGYLAIEFNTANYVDTGLLTTIETTTTNGRRLGSISQCPGDFDVADECKHFWGTGGEIFWSTEGYSKACILEPNTTYYFNVTFTDGVDPASSGCTSSACITKMRAYNPSG